MLTSFDLKRDDALQNNLLQFLKYLAESLDILKIQDKRKVELFRPPNSYILHCHVECGLLSSFFERKWYEESKKLNIIEFYSCTL